MWGEDEFPESTTCPTCGEEEFPELGPDDWCEECWGWVLVRVPDECR